MELLWKRIKTEQSTECVPTQHIYNVLQGSTGKLNCSKRSLSSSKILSTTATHRLSDNERLIQQENIRLVSRLIEIRKRRPKTSSQEQIFPPRRKQNSFRNRQILCENQRLGKSLIRIKSGKSVEKIKTDIVKREAKIKRSIKRILESNSRTATDNSPEAERNGNIISMLSREQNLPVQLVRSKLINLSQATQFKRFT